jgi:hypothetical protein
MAFKYRIAKSPVPEIDGEDSWVINPEVHGEGLVRLLYLPLTEEFQLAGDDRSGSTFDGALLQFFLHAGELLFDSRLYHPIEPWEEF